MLCLSSVSIVRVKLLNGRFKKVDLAKLGIESPARFMRVLTDGGVLRRISEGAGGFPTFEVLKGNSIAL